MTKIIHTTNTHLAREDMNQQRRQEDYFRVFEETIDYALHINADGILHTGNLFGSSSPADWVVERVQKELKRLSDFDLEFYLLFAESDLQHQSILSELIDEGYLTRLTPKWNRIGDIAVFAYDATVEHYEAGHFFPPDNTVARVAVVFDEIETATRFQNIKKFSSEVGWSLDGILIGNQKTPVERVEHDTPILSPGSPERIISWSDIDSEEQPPCQIYQYDIDDNGVKLTTRATRARPVEKFRLELQQDDTLSDIRLKIETLNLEGKVAVFEIVGEKNQTSPAKSDIKDLVSGYASVALGYDERIGSRVLTKSKIDTLRVEDDEIIDTTPVAQVFAQLQETLITGLGDKEWFQRYLWESEFKTPYIGPEDPEKSRYVWLGLVDESYNALPGASRVLQLEFGVSDGSAPGFLGREVNWGIFLGRWADEDVIESVEDNLRIYSNELANFLAANTEYLLVTNTKTLKSPSSEQIEAVIPDIKNGFLLTRDLELNDLESTDLRDEVCKDLKKLIPIYNNLSNIDNTPNISFPSGWLGLGPNTNDWNVELLASATELDQTDVESSIDNLIDLGCSRDRALKFVRRYLIDMLDGDGLFAVHGVGPCNGHALVGAGVDTIEDLKTISPQELHDKTDISLGRLKEIQKNAKDQKLISFEPDDEKIAKKLLESRPEIDSLREVDSSDEAS